MYRSNACTDLVMDVESYYCINVFNPMLDQVIDDVAQRFAAHQRQSMLLFHCMPQNAPNVSRDVVKPVIDRFSTYLDPGDHVLKNEFCIWQQYCSDKKSEIPIAISAVCALNLCSSSVYPNIHKLLQILATLPVSTAEPERMFSKVDLTLTDVRSTMSEERLEALVMIQAHRKRVIDLENSDIIDKFAESGSRKLTFSFPM